MMSQLKLPAARTDSISFLYPFNLTVDVLRLDEIDPVVSGNKWFKLKEYLTDAVSFDKKIILTFGGAYSNHIVATAAACKKYGLQSVGTIRGEEPPVLSHTLRHAIEYGMKLFFVPREDYKQKKIPAKVYDQFEEQDVYIINEGGYGPKGVEGAMSILEKQNPSYTHIIAAVGTGTTLAGLIKASHEKQTVIGIPVLKNNFSIEKEIQDLLEEKKNFTLMPQFHHGGYAKFNRELIGFMNHWYERTGIPSDFVYTGKLFFAVNQLITEKYFPEGSKLLIIHSGGLQGNESLPKGTLIF
jgi:1-aminocyclopropane-1-carboxylate deaminase